MLVRPVTRRVRVDYPNIRGSIHGSDQPRSTRTNIDPDRGVPTGLTRVPLDMTQDEKRKVAVPHPILTERTIMSTVSSTVDVDVDVTTAYNQWTQFESFPSFMAGVESITQQGPTHNHWVMKVAGVRREFDTQIVEQIPDRLIAWSSTGGDTGSHTGRVIFEPLSAASSRVMLELGWEPEGLVEKTGAALGFDQRQADVSTRDFKKFIEGRGGHETGAWRDEVR